MTLSHREKVLASVVAALGVAVAGWLLLGLFSGPLSTRRAEIAALNSKLEEKQDAVAKAKKAQDRLAQWNRQALPSELSRAGLLYQSWLLELVSKAGFRQKRVDPGDARARGDSYAVLPFTVRGQATLDELVQFLFDFYSAGHLQQIRRLTLKPSEKNKELDVTVSIESLSLPTADRTDRLSQEPSKRLALESVDQYRKAIGGRNMMAPFDPSLLAKPKAKGPPFDPSKYAFVTAIVAVNGKPEVWVKSRTSDKNFQLAQGEKLEIGPFQATIARINPRDVELEIDGKRHTIPLGGSVRGSEGVDKKIALGSGPPAEVDRPRKEEGEPKAEGRGRRREFGGPRPEFLPRREYGGPRPEPGGPRPEGGGPRPEGGPPRADAPGR